MSKLAKALTAAAGNAGESLYAEDVFSTYLYEGNGSTQTITNDIDLDGEGGLVWIKSRPDTYGHRLIDTERGVLKVLESYDTTAEATQAGSLTAFNSNGFSVGNAGHTNFSGNSFASWTFRKAEKFFDVVTYTGDGVQGRAISHNLNGNVGCVIVKRTDASSVVGWAVWHNSSDNLALNLTSAENQAFTNDILGATSTTFTVSAYSDLNASGGSYVAYLFASDAGGFGDDGDESIIKCGYATATVGTWTDVNVGFEPQWVLIKNSTATGSYNASGNAGSKDWYVIDTMRGATAATGANTQTVALSANSSIAEYNDVWFGLTSTGFSFKGVTGGSDNFIYIAIRRPMKTPESGTEVFTPALASSSGDYTAVAGFPVDMNIYSQRSSANNHFTYDRLRGGSYLATDDTSAETGDFADWDSMTDFYIGGVSGNYSDYINWMFKRATGFFDVVAYTGNNAVGRAITHNLGVAPELIFIKIRNGGNNWAVYAAPEGNTKSGRLNEGLNFFSGVSTWNSTSPTSSVFTVSGTDSEINASSYNYIAYLFATLAGVSKVGSYTGTGSNVDVDCGFSAGARFILIKRTDSTGDWYVYDSERGIVAGNDPYLLLNTTAAEVTSTDYIDPLSSGFTVTSSAPAGLNASGGTYIFLAIA